MFKRLGCVCAAACLLIVPHAVAQADEAKPASVAPAATGAASETEAYRSNPQFVATLAEAKLFEHQRRAALALDDYKRASKLAGGRCIECLQGLYDTGMKTGDYKLALAAVTQVEASAATPGLKSMAAFHRGQALAAQGGDKPKPAQMEAVHAAFQEAITLNPKNASALFLDGRELARLGKLDEARTDFEACLSCLSPSDPARLRAEHFAENPELATHKMAPAFEVTALDGSRFNLDAMGGRVVLIDFWATWCGPCNEELPHMQKIAKEFAGQPLVIISVSWDNDEAKWRAFLQKNEMTWVQYRDADHKLANEFGINSIPHYFTIDSDGVLTAEMMGSGSDVEGKLKKLIAKARKAQAVEPISGNGN